MLSFSIENSDESQKIMAMPLMGKKNDDDEKRRSVMKNRVGTLVMLILAVVAVVVVVSTTRATMSETRTASGSDKMMHIMEETKDETDKKMMMPTGKQFDDETIDAFPDQTSTTRCVSQTFSVSRGGFRDFTIPSNVASVTIDVCGSSIDTVVQIFGAGNLMIGSCDDGGSNLGGCSYCGFRNERWSLTNLQQGTTYKVRVRPYGAGGNVVLNVQCGPPIGPTTSASPTTSTSTQPGPAPSCTGPRVRKDWAHMTQQERNLFIDGFKALRANGKLARLTRTHASSISFAIAHNVDNFLPWHRYFLWELETQIRNLGGRFSCFGLPYWDWTRVSGSEASNPMFTQGLGGDGGGATGCVQTGGFREGQYVTTYGNCLRRNMCGNGRRGQCRFLPFETTQALVTGVINLDTYTRFRPYLESANHNEAHNFFGGDLLGSASPDDPFFYLLHNMVDMTWALWQDCHNYENLPRSSQTQSVVGNVQIDTGMTYAGQNGLSTASWARVRTTPVTPRDVQNIQGGFMNYKFESSILSRSGVAFGRCSFMTGSSAWIGQIPPTVQGLVASELDLHAALVAKALEGDEDAAVAVGVDAQIGYGMTHKEKRVLISDYSCKKAARLEEKNGGPPLCVFDPTIVEHCGQGPNPLNITLAELQGKRGVAGNDCLMSIRSEMYGMCAMLGTLRDLCNGYYDVAKECNYQVIELKGQEKEKYEEEERAVRKKLKEEKRKRRQGRKNGNKKKKNKNNKKNKKKKKNSGSKGEDENEMN